MEYKNIQKTTAQRARNEVKAYKILAIEDGHLIFQLWLNDTEKKGQLKVSMPEDYQVGEYVDMQVIRTSKMSHAVKLIGKTPQKFIPADGRAIAI